MIIDRICFEQLFPTGEYANQRLRIEGTLSEGESITEAFHHAKAMVDVAFKAMNPAVNLIQEDRKITETQVTKVPEDLRIANMIADINSCQDVKVLETYRLLVKGNNVLQGEYDKKFAELSGK